LLPDAPVAVTDTRPTPALVSQRAVVRLPRLALLLFCAAYLLPGVFGRDPWKNADIAAYGYMTSLLRGESSWLQPSIAGLVAEGGVLHRALGSTQAEVNSLHGQGIRQLGAGLVAEAWAPDGLIEAFRVADAATFAVAVQWHPEWQIDAHPLSRALFQAFGEACRQRRHARG
jgi:hypothetical protein